MRGVKKAQGRLERDSGMFLSRLVTSFIRALLRLVVIEIVAKLTKIEQLKKSKEVGNTATEKNLVCICVWLWGGNWVRSPQRKPQWSRFNALWTQTCCAMSLLYFSGMSMMLSVFWQFYYSLFSHCLRHCAGKWLTWSLWLSKPAIHDRIIWMAGDISNFQTANHNRFPKLAV